MLEKMFGARNLVLAGAVLFVGACANTDKSALDSTPQDTTPPQEELDSAPREDVTVEPEQVGPPAGSQEDLDVTAGSRIYFGFDRYDLSPEARDTLQDQAKWLMDNPSVSVTVEGHADERGTREYNLALGDRRANSVKNYLVALGVTPSRIRTVSYGKERPAVLGSGESVWSQNRRAFTRVD